MQTFTNSISLSRSRLRVINDKLFFLSIPFIHAFRKTMVGLQGPVFALQVESHK